MKSKFAVSLLFSHLRTSRTVTNTAIILISWTFILLSVSVVALILGRGSGLHDTIHAIFSLSVETSLGERYMWALSIICAFGFMLAALEARSRMLFAFALLFGYVWVDDSMQYHEFFGDILSQTYALPVIGSLRPQDTGELIAWGLAAGALVPAFLWAFFHRKPGEGTILVVAGCGFAGLAAFGAGIDMLHQIVPKSLVSLVGLVEDGGEILVNTLNAILAIGLAVVARGFLADARDRMQDRESRAAFSNLGNARMSFTPIVLPVQQMHPVD